MHDKTGHVPCHQRDAGGGTIVMVCVAAALLGATIGPLVVVGSALIDQQRAQNGADAVALAAVIGGSAEAYRIAELNDVSIVELTISGGVATVTVVRDSHPAMARADKRP